METEKLLFGRNLSRYRVGHGSGHSRTQNSSGGHGIVGGLTWSDHKSRVAVYTKLCQTNFGLDTSKKIHFFFYYNDYERILYKFY